MREEWTVQAKRRMYANRIQAKQIAEETGYYPSYISEILNGRRKSERAKVAILAALDRLEYK